MAVTNSCYTVLEKKKDWPKLQDATADPFLPIDTPRLFVLIISSIKSSKSDSAKKEEKYEIFDKQSVTKQLFVFMIKNSFNL